MNAPDPECPRDHIKVDNDQRVTTLQQLKLSKLIKFRLVFVCLFF